MNGPAGSLQWNCVAGQPGPPSCTNFWPYLPCLQGADRSFAFASGMAALSAVLRLCVAGDHVVAGDDVYGGTSRLLERVAPALGLTVSNVDTSEIE